MRLDPLIIETVKKNLKEKNQSEKLTNLVLDWFDKKDEAKITSEKKDELIDKIIKEIKI